MIPLHQPALEHSDLDAVMAALRSGRLTMGPNLLAFEHAMARRTRRMHGVGVSSGSVAMEIALKALGIGPGDEVLVSAFGYSPNVNAVLHVGAKPVFVDADPVTLNMDPARVDAAITPATRAMLVAETFGNPAGMPDLISICSRLEIPMVENATEALGCTLGQDNAGRFGRLACFGFFESRPITTGEGGMIVTHDDHLAAACRAMRHQGRVDKYSFPDQPQELGTRLQHAHDGFDARLNEMCAALGVSQLHRLDRSMARRQEIADAYIRRLAGESDLILPSPPAGCTMSWSNFVVRLSDRFTREDRDAVIDGLHRLDIGAADWWPCPALLPHVRQACRHQPGDFPVAERVADRTIALPFFERIGEHDLDEVCDSLRLVMSRIGASR
jgi:perosamine synthetase